MDQLTGPGLTQRPARLWGRLAAMTAILATIFCVGGAATAATTWTVPLAANSTGQAQAAAVTAPTGVGSVCSGSGNNKTPVVISWTAVPGAPTYTISQAPTANGPYVAIATGVTGTSYSLTPSPAGTYYWKITTTRSTWTGPPSAGTSRTTSSNGNCS